MDGYTFLYVGLIAVLSIGLWLTGYFFGYYTSNKRNTPEPYEPPVQLETHKSSWDPSDLLDPIVPYSEEDLMLGRDMMKVPRRVKDGR